MHKYKSNTSFYEKFKGSYLCHKEISFISHIYLWEAAKHWFGTKVADIDSVATFWGRIGGLFISAE